MATNTRSRNAISEFRKKDTFWRRWSAVIILITFFLLSWAGQFVSQYQVEKQQAEQHGETFSMSEYWPEFWGSTFENWQSEWLQLTAQAILVVGFAEVLFRKGNEEHYKTQVMINELEDEISKLKRGHR